MLTAHDGDEGLEVYEQSTGDIDAIVMDECMPRMCGAEYLKAIRQLDSDIGNITQSVRDEAFRPILTASLDKPYHIDDLVNEIHRLLAAA